MTKHVTLACATIALAAVIGSGAQMAVAQTTAINDGNWSNGGTWSAGEPSGTLDATIDGGHVVTIDQAGELTNRIDVGTASGQSGTLTITGGDLAIIDSDPAEPNLPSIRIGQAAGSSGALNMSGGTVYIDGDGGFAIGDLMIGDVGNGTMTMTDGTMQMADEMIIGTQATSTATVDFSGGTMETLGRSILVGFAGHATLNVSDTANLRANFDMLTSFIQGSTATINQSGGTIEVGFLFTNFDNNAASTGSTTTINMTGGTFTTRIAYVLGRGPGTTTMAHSGGTVNAMQGNGELVAGDGPGSTATYAISGSATVNVLNNIVMGRDGVGAWTQTGGTTNAANVFLGDYDTSQGTMTVSGGALNLSGNLNVGAALASNAAPDRVTPDGTNGPQGQALDANGVFIVQGAGGDINVGGNLLANPADKSPARNAPGDENSSLLQFTLGSTGISAIEVGLKADLDGAVIDIDDSAGYFIANPAATLTLISAAGGFGNVFTVTPTEQAGTGKGFSLAPGDAAAFNVQIVPRTGGGENLVVSKGAGGTPGDIDSDGDVDGADFLAIQRGFGTTTSAADMTTWRTNFGTGSAVAAAGAVPEPSAALLAIGAGLGALVLRRRAV
ncbi:MAG: hypothetical protein IT424_13495 [Pirellulales bacterium]|nr:hypothetical protein [Pirellulales bacterium]